MVANFDWSVPNELWPSNTTVCAMVYNMSVWPKPHNWLNSTDNITIEESKGYIVNLFVNYFKMNTVYFQKYLFSDLEKTLTKLFVKYWWQYPRLKREGKELFYLPRNVWSIVVTFMDVYSRQK